MKREQLCKVNTVRHHRALAAWCLTDTHSRDKCALGRERSHREHTDASCYVIRTLFCASPENCTASCSLQELVHETTGERIKPYIWVLGLMKLLLQMSNCVLALRSHGRESKDGKLFRNMSPPTFLAQITPDLPNNIFRLSSKAINPDFSNINIWCVWSGSRSVKPFTSVVLGLMMC